MEQRTSMGAFGICRIASCVPSASNLITVVTARMTDSRISKCYNLEVNYQKALRERSMSAEEARKIIRNWLQTSPVVRPLLLENRQDKILELAKKELGLYVAVCLICNGDGERRGELCRGCNGHRVVYRIRDS